MAECDIESGGRCVDDARDVPCACPRRICTACVIRECDRSGQAVSCPWCRGVVLFQELARSIYPGGVLPEVVPDTANDPLLAGEIVPLCGSVGNHGAERATRCLCERGRYYDARWLLRDVAMPQPFRLLRCAGGCGSCKHAACAAHAPAATGEWYCDVCRVAAAPATPVQRRSTRLRVGDMVMVRWWTGVRYVGQIESTGLPHGCVDVHFFADSSIASIPRGLIVRDY